MVGKNVLPEKIAPAEPKSSKIVRSLSKGINRGRINAAFFTLDEMSQVAFAALIRADSSANECLSELNVIVLLRSATRYA